MSRFAAFFLCATLALSAFAQVHKPDSGPTSASITVRVLLPDGQAAPQNIQVQLLSTNYVPIANAFTGENGEAAFNPVPSGFEYRLEVTGDRYETVNVDFYIEAGETVHHEFVTIHEKKDDNPSAPGGSVSLFDLKVPNDARKELEKGDNLAEQKQWAEASLHYLKAIEKFPNYATAYYNLGAARMNLNDTAGAKDAFQHAVTIDPKYARAWAGLARIAMSQHDLQTAEADFRKAITVEPMNAQVLTLMGQTELQLHNFADAEAIARKVHALPHQGLAIVHVIGGSAYENDKRPADAIAEYQLYLKEDPNGPLVAKVNEAIAGLQKAIAKP